MNRFGLGILAVAVATLAGGWLAGASAAHEQTGTPAGSPTPVSCGQPASNGGWGGASASNVRVQLHEVQPVPGVVATPAATPATLPQTALNVTIVNQGTAALPYRLVDFQLLDCAGNWHPAVASGRAPALQQGTLAPGASLSGWVGFEVPSTTRGAVFVYQIEASGQTGAQVRFPLAQLPRGAVANLHPPAIATPGACSPGSAGNAVGGNAVGGNGGNGGSATGGSAQAGAGNPGADAIGGSAIGCPSTPAS